MVGKTIGTTSSGNRSERENSRERRSLDEAGNGWKHDDREQLFC